LRYNVIHIDACTLKDNVATNCPVDVFYKEENLDILSKLITSKGVVIVNVLNVTGRPYTAAKKVKAAFEKAFKQCTDHISEFSPLNTTRVLIEELQFQKFFTMNSVYHDPM
ncbi:hypothetical protein OSTOST_23034, partial [Ostertagia ostertagi]